MLQSIGHPDEWVQKEGIRANLKSEDILRRLLQRYPDGCPRYVKEPIRRLGWFNFLQFYGTVSRRRSLEPDKDTSCRPWHTKRAM